MEKIAPEKTKNSAFLQRTWLNALFSLVLAAIIIINIVVYLQLQKFLVADNWIIHTYQVMQAANKTLLNELDAESVTRGYLITGDESFLQNLNQKFIDMKSNYELTKRLTVDNPIQQKKLADLAPLLDERINIFLQTIQFKKEQKLQTPEGLNLMRRAQELTDQIKASIQDIYKNEFALLEERTHTAWGSLNTTIIVLTIVNVLSIISLVTIIILFNRQLIRQMRTEEKLRTSEALLSGIIDGTTDFVAALDQHYNLIAFNHAYAEEYKRIYGKTIELGDNLKELLTRLPEDQQSALKIWERALKGENFTIIASFGDPKLARNEYELTFSPIYNEQGELIGASHIARNIAKRLEAEKAMISAKEEAEKALHELKQHDHEISLINEMNRVLQSSISLEEALMVIGNYCHQLLETFAGSLYIMNPSHNYLELAAEWNNPQSKEKLFFPDQCWGLRQAKIYRYHKNIPCKHVNEKIKFPPYFCVPLFAQNDIIGLLYLEIKNSKSMTEKAIDRVLNSNESLISNLAGHISLAISNIKLRDSLTKQSVRDPLTSLYNRSYLTESLDRDIQRAKRDNVSLAIVMIDLDNFKKINDTFGHEAGDLVLKTFGKLLSNHIRKSDIACRYGGEEFLLMLYGVTVEEAVDRAEQLRNAVSEINIQFGHQLIGTVTISLGIAMYPEHDEEMETLIRAADSALYQSKKTGRNKVTVYTIPS